MYSPWSQLPAPDPKDAEYPLGYFYENTAKHLIKDTVRVMDNGLSIDLGKVIKLEENLSKQLAEVREELASNPLIKKYLEHRYQKQIQEYIEDRQSKMRQSEYYLVPFKHKDIFHRSYFMDIYAEQKGWSSPEDKLPTGIGKWPANLVKKYAKTNKVLQMLLEGALPADTPTITTAMCRLSEDKAKIYNEKYVKQVKVPVVAYPEFNPGSPQQKQELFAMLGIESEDFSKETGLPKWDRAQVERVNIETIDEDVRHLTLCFIDYSFAAIIKNNFIEAFYNFTVNGRLHGQYKLLGAKTGRYTSASPNMLNSPSSGSRFAKAVKQCLTAPKGKVILAADYGALEDRVIASLSRDTNKCNVFLNDLDGHSLNSIGYFPQRIKVIMELTGDSTIDAKAFEQLAVIESHPIAKAIRFESKGPTFGLAYGAYPPKIAATLKITLEAAEEIFYNYHYVLYPGITEYREGYVLPTAQAQGYIHLGLGFNLQTDDPNKDIRTLANATCQFWSILTALTINKMHQLIDDIKYEEDVKVISTIYDSIYFEVTEDPVIIKWVNDNLISTMLVDFMVNQTIKNAASSEIGYDWATMKPIPVDGSTEDIIAVIKQLNSSPTGE
jgi:hypothetical protein